MCNNNLAAPQSKFETSIFFEKVDIANIYIRKACSVAGSSHTKLIGQHNLSPYRRAFSIYRKEDVLFQLKVRGVSEKFKNQLRPFSRPRSINFRQHFRNLSHKTVPLRSMLTIHTFSVSLFYQLINTNMKPFLIGFQIVKDIH